MWHDVGHSFCGCGCGWVPVREFLCLFWCETHTKGLRARFPTKTEDDEERQSPKAVNRSWGKVAIKERWLPSEELGPMDPDTGLVSAKEWVSVPDSCVGIFEYTLVTDTDAQNARKVPKTSPFLHSGLTQVRACLFCFLPLSVVYVVSCVFVKQCEIPMVGDERNH